MSQRKNTLSLIQQLERYANDPMRCMPSEKERVLEILADLRHEVASGMTCPEESTPFAPLH